MRGSIAIRPRSLPKPLSPRSDAGSSVTSTDRGVATRNHDELGDPHTLLDDECPLLVGVEKDDFELAAVAAVDEAWRVDDRDAVLSREPGARMDEAGVAFRDRDGEAGSDECPRAGRQLYSLGRGKVEPRVAGVRAHRQRRVRRAAA